MSKSLRANSKEKEVPKSRQPLRKIRSEPPALPDLDTQGQLLTYVDEEPIRGWGLLEDLRKVEVKPPNF